MPKIIVFPNSILRSKTPEISRVDGQLLAEIEDLKNILKTAENGAGLASTQIGIAKRFFGLKLVDNKKTKVQVLINPKVEKAYGEKVYPKLVDEENKKEEDFLEGCLSFPDWWGTVKRHLKIEAKWQELEEGVLKNKSKIMTGFEAIVFQHELDHLDGILFVDHIKAQNGKFYKWNGKDKKMMKWNVEMVVREEK